jgi:beta-glucosidase
MKELQRSATEAQAKPMSRRALLQKTSVAAVAGMIGNASFTKGRERGGGEVSMRAATAGTEKGKTGKAFPDKFLWGCATAGHQVEGNNINSDLWAMDHMPESIFKEPSGDACDHYHLYPQDIAMLADLGFNTYRFSLEWARIEPEEGFFSNAELEHYRRVLMTCREHHLTTLVTYSHFSMPRWFACKGGWQNPGAADLYARFCEKATKHLGDLVDYASTFNEPDIPQLLNWINLPGTGGQSIVEMMQGNLPKVRKYLKAPEFASFFVGDGKTLGTACWRRITRVEQR